MLEIDVSSLLLTENLSAFFFTELDGGSPIEVAQRLALPWANFQRHFLEK